MYSMPILLPLAKESINAVAPSSPTFRVLPLYTAPPARLTPYASLSPLYAFTNDFVRLETAPKETHGLFQNAKLVGTHSQNTERTPFALLCVGSAHFKRMEPTNPVL